MAEAPDVTELDEVVDLYRIDPSEFVEARAALVKQLRAEERADEARAVAKLRKPTVAAWALNQVADEAPELIDAALEAGEVLRAATIETLEGDATNLRGATDAEREAAKAVVDRARALLPSLTTEHRDRMASTLRAAIADDEVRAQLEAGLLSSDHEPPAMGFAAAGASGGGRRAKPATGARSKAATRRVGGRKQPAGEVVDEVDAKRQQKEAERRAAEEAERQRAAEEAAERERQQAVLDAAATEASAEADRLEAAAVEAEAAATAARSAADAAAAAAHDARAAAEAGPAV